MSYSSRLKLVLFLIFFISTEASAATKTLVRRFPSDTPVQVAPLSGPTPPGNCVKFDANGNIIDSGAPCGSGTAPGGSSGNLQWNNAGSFDGVSGSSVVGSTVILQELNLFTPLDIGSGGTGLSGAADDTVLLSDGANWQAVGVPDCTDTGGNHLNYTIATNSFSCGTTSSGGGGGSTTWKQNGTTVVSGSVANFNDPDATAFLIENPSGTARFDMSLYALLGGRVGGQSLNGGVATGENLDLHSNTTDDGYTQFDTQVRIGKNPIGGGSLTGETVGGATQVFAINTSSSNSVTGGLRANVFDLPAAFISPMSVIDSTVIPVYAPGSYDISAPTQKSFLFGMLMSGNATLLDTTNDVKIGLFSNALGIIADGTSQTMGQAVSFETEPGFRGKNSATLTITNSQGLWDNMSADTESGGLVDITNHSTIDSNISVGEGSTINNRRGLWYQNYRPSGSGRGVIENTVALDVEDQVNGNFVTATLSANLAINDTTVSLVDSSALPSEGYFSVSSQLIFYTSNDTGTNTLTLLSPSPVAASSGNTISVFDPTGFVNLSLRSTGPLTEMRHAGLVQLGLAGTRTGKLQFNGITSGAVTVKTADVAGTWSLTLPTNDGDSGDVLTTDGAGITSWQPASGGGSPGGSPTQVQYNNTGTFGGITNTATDGTTLQMTSPEIITSVLDSNANTLLGITATGSAVNYLTLGDAATGNNPTLDPTGSDSNIGVDFNMKGTGQLRVLGSSSIIGFNNGFTVDGNTAKALRFAMTGGTNNEDLVMDLDTTANTALLSSTTSLGTVDFGSIVIKTNAIANLTTNGFVKTSSGNGTLIVDTNTYLTGNQSISLTGDVTGSGTTSIATTASANIKVTTFGITVDGAGVTPSTGSKGYITVPYAGTITKWYIVADQSGSCVVDIKRSGTSIIGGGGNKPTLSSAQRANATPSSWTSTSVSAHDEFEFNLDSATTVTRVNLMIEVAKT